MVFTVFTESNCLTSSPIMRGPQFIRPQSCESTGLSGLGAMLESYHKL